MTVDLHTHSTASDGILAPSELLQFGPRHVVQCGRSSGDSFVFDRPVASSLNANPYDGHPNPDYGGCCKQYLAGVPAKIDAVSTTLLNFIKTVHPDFADLGAAPFDDGARPLSALHASPHNDEPLAGVPAVGATQRAIRDKIMSQGLLLSRIIIVSRAKI